MPVNICDTCTPEIHYVEMHISRSHGVFAQLHVWTTIRVEVLACAWTNHMYTYFTENSVKYGQNNSLNLLLHIFQHTNLIW